jgi:hypothetical protein
VQICPQQVKLEIREIKNKNKRKISKNNEGKRNSGGNT